MCAIIQHNHSTTAAHVLGHWTLRGSEVRKSGNGFTVRSHRFAL